MTKNFRYAVLVAAFVFTSFTAVTAQRAVSAVSDRVSEAADKSGKGAERSARPDLLSGPPSLDLISAATYPMTVANGVALEDMSTGTTQLVAPGVDDTASPVTNMGFEFWYDGVRHNLFSVNANGLARLGGTAVTTAFDNASGTGGFATTTNAPKIAPYFEDMCVGTNGKIHYKVVGSAPNRKLVVEWSNMQVTRGAGCVFRQR